MESQLERKEDGVKVFAPAAPGVPAVDACLSPDGTALAVANAEGAVCFASVANGEYVQEFYPSGSFSDRKIVSIEFLNDRNTTVDSSGDFWTNMVVLWEDAVVTIHDLLNWNLIQEISLLFGGRVDRCCLALDPSSEYMLLSNFDNHSVMFLKLEHVGKKLNGITMAREIACPITGA